MMHGMWNVNGLHLLPGQFLSSTGKRDHVFYKKGDASGYPDTFPFEVSSPIV
jgi:hypothetical protein